MPSFEKVLFEAGVYLVEIQKEVFEDEGDKVGGKAEVAESKTNVEELNLINEKYSYD